MSKKSGPKIANSFHNKVLAYCLDFEGTKQEDIAQLLGINKRTVYNYIKQVESLITRDFRYMIAVMIGKRIISKSFDVILKYLDGKGEKVGGDLAAAAVILRPALRAIFNPNILKGIMPGDAGDLPDYCREGTGDIEGGKSVTINQTNLTLKDTKMLITADNCPINVNPQPDKEFADALPGEFERIIRTFERLTIGPVVTRGSSEPENPDS